MDSKAWYENNIEPYYTFKKVNLNIFYFQAHNNSVETVIFNPVNFNELISGSHDQTIKIWDIQKFQQTQTLKGHKYILNF